MTGSTESLVDVERHRLQLEQNIAKLQAALRHWQQWEIEYEGMKEEIVDLGIECLQSNLEKFGENLDNKFLNTFDDVLLTPKERRLLLLDDKRQLRNSRQVLGLLSRRIDYVQQNVKTVSTLLEAAEDKCGARSILIQPEVTHEEGLPLTEIHEELDDEGNIISATTSKPDDKAPQLVEALGKAGIRVSSDTSHLPEARASQAEVVTSCDVPASSQIGERVPGCESVVSGTDTNRLSSDIRDTDTDNSRRRRTAPRKSVSFADGTKTTSDHKRVGIVGNTLPNTKAVIKPSKSDEDQLRNDAIRAILAVDSLSSEDKTKAVSAVLSKGLSQPSLAHADKASNSGMEEPIATFKSARMKEDPERKSATLIMPEKVETTSEQPFEPVIPTNESPEDAALRRQMIQYNMGEIGAVVAELELDEDGTSYSDDDDEDYLDDSSSIEEDEDKFGRTKQRVLSNEYLTEMKALEKRLKNIGPNPDAKDPPAHNPNQQPQSSNPTPSTSTIDPPNSTAKKSVRFATALDIQETPIPNPPSPAPAPAHPIHAPIIIERPFTASISEPNDHDPALIRQQVATEYHKMRNRIIQRQGGFTARDDDEDSSAQVPLAEDEGGPKKMSRFKAARLRRG